MNKVSPIKIIHQLSVIYKAFNSYKTIHKCLITKILLHIVIKQKIPSFKRMDLIL